MKDSTFAAGRDPARNATLWQHEIALVIQRNSKDLRPRDICGRFFDGAHHSPAVRGNP